MLAIASFILLASSHVKSDKTIDTRASRDKPTSSIATTGSGNSRGISSELPVSASPTVAIGSRSDALDYLTGGDLQMAAGEKKYMLVKKKPKHKKIKMEVFEPKMKYKKIKMKVPVKQMKKKKVKGYLVKKHHHYEHH